MNIPSKNAKKGKLQFLPEMSLTKISSTEIVSFIMYKKKLSKVYKFKPGKLFFFLNKLQVNSNFSTQFNYYKYKLFNK